MSFRQGATTADTCTGNCITWRRNWVCWDLLVFQTRTNTTELCGRFREWSVSSSTTCPRRTWKAPASMAAPVQRRASTEILPRREDCRGGLCLLAGPWWSPPVVCQVTSLWCTVWPTGKYAPSAGWSPWWCPSSRVSLLHNRWRWVKLQCMMGHWIGFQMLTEVRDEDYPYNPHFYLTFIELHFATMWRNNTQRSHWMISNIFLSTKCLGNGRQSKLQTMIYKSTLNNEYCSV